MALLRVSYVLLCAVAGVDILDIIIAEYTAQSPVVLRCGTKLPCALVRLLPELKRGCQCIFFSCSLVPGHTLSPALLTATTAPVDNTLSMLCKHSHGTPSDQALHQSPHMTGDKRRAGGCDRVSSLQYGINSKRTGNWKLYLTASQPLGLQQFCAGGRAA